MHVCVRVCVCVFVRVCFIADDGTDNTDFLCATPLIPAYMHQKTSRAGARVNGLGQEGGGRGDSSWRVGQRRGGGGGVVEDMDGEKTKGSEEAHCR